jgi:RHH-type rel operon transcriptional repressor/antitoxin RelB
MSAISVELPEAVSARLNELAERTGRSKAEYVIEAVTEHLDELDDLTVAEQRMRDHLAGRSQSYSLDEVEKRLGLVD